METKMNGNGHVDVEEIEVDEEKVKSDKTKTWTEEFNVAAEDLMAFVRNLAREANIRRVIIKHDDKVVLDIPLWVGIGGIAMIPTYGALAVIAVLASNHSILVERQEPAEE